MGVSVPQSEIEQVRAQLAAAEQALSELREQRRELSDKYHSGELPGPLRSAAREVLMDIPGMTFGGKNNHTTVAGLLDVIRGMSKMLSHTYDKADKAEAELDTVNGLLGAIGEVIIRGQKIAEARRSPGSSNA